MKISKSITLGTLVGAFALLASSVQAQTVVNFDNVTGADDYQAVTSGGPDGPTYSAPGVTFTGGVVLNGAAHFDSLETSAPNLYATAVANVGNIQFVNNEIDGGTTPLPGIITGTFATPGEFSSINLDIINSVAWNSVATFTAYDSSNQIVSQLNQNLIGFFYDGDLNQVFNDTLTGNNISYFTLSDAVDDPNSTGAETAAPGLAIDSVTLATPEPSAFVGIGLGILLIGALAIRARKQTLNPQA